MSFPGTLYLIDTSAAQRVHIPAVRQRVETLIARGLAATTATLDLEAAFSARTAAAVPAVLQVRKDGMHTLPLTESTALRAREIMELLAASGLHRAAGSLDVLTAAVAEHYRAILLHYDADFEHIASVTGQHHQWIAPRGSLT